MTKRQLLALQYISLACQLVLVSVGSQFQLFYMLAAIVFGIQAARKGDK